MINNEYKIDEDLKYEYYQILDKYQNDIYIRYGDSNLEDSSKIKIKLENKRLKINPELKTNQFWITIIIDSQDFCSQPPPSWTNLEKG